MEDGTSAEIPGKTAGGIPDETPGVIRGRTFVTILDCNSEKFQIEHQEKFLVELYWRNNRFETSPIK